MKMKNLLFACALGLIGNSCMGMNNAQNPSDTNHKNKREKMLSSIKANMAPLTNWNVIITAALANEELLDMSVRSENGNTFREIAGLMNRYPTHEEYIRNVLWSSDVSNYNIVFGQALHTIMKSRSYEIIIGDTSILSATNAAKDKNKHLLPNKIDVWSVGVIDIELEKIAFLNKTPAVSVEIAALLYHNPDYRDYIVQTLIDGKVDITHITLGTMLCGLARESMRK